MLKDLSYELELVTDWQMLGIRLGVKVHEIRMIASQYHELQRCQIEVLWRWLCKDQNCTWRKVVEVLIEMGEEEVAETIELKYLTLTTGGLFFYFVLDRVTYLYA